MSEHIGVEPPAEGDPVGDDVVVFRLIPTSSCDVVDGNWEFQSGAFDNASPEFEGDADDCMSVVLGDHLVVLDRLPQNLPAETPWTGPDYGVAALEVGFLRNVEDQEILRTPSPVEPAHGDVKGAKNPKRRRRLKKHAVWVIRPAVPPR